MKDIVDAIVYLTEAGQGRGGAARGGRCARWQMVTRENSQPASPEQRLKELGILLSAPPEPFGTYVEAVRTGNLLFLSGMLPTESHGAKFGGRLGAELDVETARKAAHLAALNVLAVAKKHLGTLDKVTRIVRLGVAVVAARRLWKRQEPLPPGVRRRKPSARHAGRAGSHFRGAE